MNKKQVAKKYARVLINTVDVSVVPRVIEELKGFSKLVDNNKKLKVLFISQIFSEREKEASFKELSSPLKFNPGTEKLLKMMIIRKHLSAIHDVITASVDAYNEKQKKATAVVVSSVSLDENNTGRLKAALKQMTQREITIENQIDKSLLGGFIVKVGSTIFDSSLKGQLRLLKTELMK
jgi:ATP synthase F1 delta subunit